MRILRVVLDVVPRYLDAAHNSTGRTAACTSTLSFQGTPSFCHTVLQYHGAERGRHIARWLRRPFRVRSILVHHLTTLLYRRYFSVCTWCALHASGTCHVKFLSKTVPRGRILPGRAHQLACLTSPLRAYTVAYYLLHSSFFLLQ